MTSPSPIPTAAQVPNRIWLLLNEGDQGEHVWCDCPDPDNSERIAVEYVRAATIPSPDADKAPAEEAARIANDVERRYPSIKQALASEYGEFLSDFWRVVRNSVAERAALAQITAERDRLREALKKIAHSEIIGWVKDCAEDALAPPETTGG